VAIVRLPKKSGIFGVVPITTVVTDVVAAVPAEDTRDVVVAGLLVIIVPVALVAAVPRVVASTDCVAGEAVTNVLLLVVTRDVVFGVDANNTTFGELLPDALSSNKLVLAGTLFKVGTVVALVFRREVI
jgi:hypothetical protein